jgi:hypothetical protein
MDQIVGAALAARDRARFPTLPTAEEQHARRRAQLVADLTVALTWIRDRLGPEKWQAISLRMARLPDYPPDRVASLVSSAIDELGDDELVVAIGMLDEFLDDIVTARPTHRALFPTEVIVLERVRDTLARV